ncbi:DNA polymerase I [Fervidibacter sacchari]|uniref:DNA polymerase I n=1 Tax=Candidatus Fervidibacter sacchari TaxID=1448929 RepID=A0ABT2EJR4_9BACT|nr:DNA polymerase I [Candidatus Fervidibacter sacchari]MCS3918202.1 DNA polymerase-1 [Candidatus Fervidibacter sacchari]WKU16006.1 DNA polymerase I [Candidatus Fervidibacter sacchari]
MPKLVVVDGHSLLFRAFFAVPPLSTKDGTPTNAVYGFLRMLIKLWREEKPDYLVVTFDAPTPTFRHRAFAEYKATRAKAPDAFRPQVILVKQVLKTMGIPFWEIEGYEADDLMGAAVQQAKQKGLQVVLVTGDMDALQLVGDGVTVLMPKRGISEMERYDAERVKQEFGVPPELIPDLKGLAGDTSDNLPGVPGIGEKTAKELLQQFGSLEAVLENALKITVPRIRENIVRFAEQAKLCKQLATIKTDAPLELNLPELAVSNWRIRTMETAEMLLQLEMRSLLEELGLTDLLRDQQAVKGRVITAEHEWQELLNAVRQHGRVAVAVDVVGAGRTAALRGFALAFGNEVAYVTGEGREGEADQVFGSLFAPTGQKSTSVKDRLLALLSDPTIVKVAHGFKELFHQIKIGVDELERIGRDPHGFEDTELLAYLLNPGQSDYELQRIALERKVATKWQIDWQDSTQREFKISAPTSVCELALTVAELSPILEREVKEAEMWELWEHVEMPLIFVLTDMERHGVLIDVNYLRQLGEEMMRASKQVEERIHQIAGVRFNIRSPQQLAEVLFNRLKLPMPKRTPSGKPSTAAPVLEALAKEHEIARLVLEFRELEKLRSTFVEGLLSAADPQHRVHTTYDQTGTATGRLASSEPNLQNIPARGDWGKKIRRAFIAPKGYRLISADYSQIELRILAHLSGDEALCQAFERGEDIHTQAAVSVFGVKPEEVTEDMRRKAKVLNFGIAYGISAYGLAQQLGIEPEEAQQIIDRYFERFPKVRNYIEQIIEFARQHKFVRTLMNRRRFLPDIDNPDQRLREAAQRAAINTPVQGTSADIMKAAMVTVWRGLKERGYDAHITMQVHDELVLEVAENQVLEVAKFVKRQMESVFKLRVPLVAEIKVGDNWGEMERIL